MEKRYFLSSSDSHKQFNGMVEIVRPLTSKEADIHDVGLMYKCRAASGEIFDAYGDELLADNLKESPNVDSK